MTVRLFPIRHHSPSASRCLAELIARDPPKAILIEGPVDAEPLIPVVVHPDTEPPISILAYVPGGDGLSGLWPFVSYSAEYAALREATARGIRVGFCDVPAAVSMAKNRQDREKEEAALGAGTAPPDGGEGGHEERLETLPARAGYESFDEFWETTFEMPAHTPEEYVRISLEFGRLVRAFQAEELKDPEHWDRVRERCMRSRVQGLVGEGVPEEDILVVCGAFHAAAFADGDFLPGGAGPAPAPTELTVIPYSYFRMAQQIGYGAGNRAPYFYQAVYDHRGDFRRTALEALLGIAEQLRFRGHVASLADVIDGYRLCNILARMRRKAGPGLEEIHEATVACMLQGRPAVLDEAWRTRVIGTSVGKVSSLIGRTSLQEEFRREVATRRIPATDEKAEFWLHMTSEKEIGTGVFLHRLRVAEVPFANLVTEASATAILSQVREKWATQWTPATEVALVERIVLGQTLAQVCESTLRRSLGISPTLGEASRVLLEVAICDLRGMYDETLLRVEHASATGDDVYELAVASQNVASLLSYGTTRNLDKARLTDLLLRLFHRASTAIPRIGRTDDEGADKACTALKILHEISQAHARDDRMYIDTMEWASETSGLHPQVSGLAASLLHLSKVITDERLETLVRGRLGGGADPIQGAQYLSGLLSTNRATLVKNRAVVSFLDGLITGLPADVFVNVVPVLRRSLGGMSRAEVSYLLENVFALHRVLDRRAGEAVVSERDMDSLRQADSELKGLSDEWEDLFRKGG